MNFIKKFSLLSCLFYIALLGTGYFIQYVLYVDPCLLCMLQRALFYLLIFISLFFFIIPKIPQIKSLITTYLALNITCGVLGNLLAARQLWLQQLPADKVPACLPGFDKMLELYPILDIITMAIQGSGDCSEVTFTIFGFSIAFYSFITFLFIISVNLYLLFFGKKWWT